MISDNPSQGCDSPSALYKYLAFVNLPLARPTMVGPREEIVAPKEAENLPVMFWIHGGASRFGSGGESIYLTSKFAEKDVILVTTNYRLGSLGWFAHPRLSAESENNVSGNYGSLDMIAALKWVKNNIRAFGGDPSNVTIFGESAGGQAVGTLLASPFTKGLFHKAISQSGSGIFTTRNLRKDSKLISAEKIGIALADHFGPAQVRLASEHRCGCCSKRSYTQLICHPDECHPDYAETQQ